jgi:hypothetical protein
MLNKKGMGELWPEQQAGVYKNICSDKKNKR